MIEIMNIHNCKPSEPYDIKVCRGKSLLGNPFFMATESERDCVCNKYEEWFKLNSEINSKVIFELNRIKNIYLLFGKLRLFCWCAPKRCHAETIRNYILKNSNKKESKP
jgi:hypothetical protein